MTHLWHRANVVHIHLRAVMLNRVLGKDFLFLSNSFLFLRSFQLVLLHVIENLNFKIPHPTNFSNRTVQATLTWWSTNLQVESILQQDLLLISGDLWPKLVRFRVVLRMSSMVEVGIHGLSDLFGIELSKYIYQWDPFWYHWNFELIYSKNSKILIIGDIKSQKFWPFLTFENHLVVIYLIFEMSRSVGCLASAA